MIEVHISEELAAIAARWWGDLLMEPPSHDNGDAFQSVFGRLLAASEPPVSPAQRDAFVAALARAIARSTDRYTYVFVDYDPCGMLEDAAAEAGRVHLSRLPWKTRMLIHDGEIAVARGYGAAFETIWPTPKRSDR